MKANCKKTCGLCGKQKAIKKFYVKAVSTPILKVIKKQPAVYIVREWQRDGIMEGGSQIRSHKFDHAWAAKTLRPTTPGQQM